MNVCVCVCHTRRMRDINLIAISHGNWPTVGARVCVAWCGARKVIKIRFIKC